MKTKNFIDSNKSPNEYIFKFKQNGVCYTKIVYSCDSCKEDKVVKCFNEIGDEVECPTCQTTGEIVYTDEAFNVIGVRSDKIEDFISGQNILICDENGTISTQQMGNIGLSTPNTIEVQLPTIDDSWIGNTVKTNFTECTDCETIGNKEKLCLQLYDVNYDNTALDQVQGITTSNWLVVNPKTGTPVEYTKWTWEADGINFIPTTDNSFTVTGTGGVGYDQHFTLTIPVLNANNPYGHTWEWFNAGPRSYRIWSLLGCDPNILKYGNMEVTIERDGKVKTVLATPTFNPIDKVYLWRCTNCDGDLKNYYDASDNVIEDLHLYVSQESGVPLNKLTQYFPTIADLEKCFGSCNPYGDEPEIPEASLSCSFEILEMCDFTNGLDDCGTLTECCDYEFTLGLLIGQQSQLHPNADGYIRGFGLQPDPSVQFFSYPRIWNGTTGTWEANADTLITQFVLDYLATTNNPLNQAFNITATDITIVNTNASTKSVRFSGCHDGIEQLGVSWLWTTPNGPVASYSYTDWISKTNCTQVSSKVEFIREVNRCFDTSTGDLVSESATDYEVAGYGDLDTQIEYEVVGESIICEHGSNLISETVCYECAPPIVIPKPPVIIKDIKLLSEVKGTLSSEIKTITPIRAKSLSKKLANVKTVEEFNKLSKEVSKVKATGATCPCVKGDILQAIIWYECGNDPTDETQIDHIDYYLNGTFVGNDFTVDGNWRITECEPCNTCAEDVVRLDDCTIEQLKPCINCPSLVETDTVCNDTDQTIDGILIPSGQPIIRKTITTFTQVGCDCVEEDVETKYFNFQDPTFEFTTIPAFIGACNSETDTVVRCDRNGNEITVVTLTVFTDDGGVVIQTYADSEGNPVPEPLLPLSICNPDVEPLKGCIVDKDGNKIYGTLHLQYDSAGNPGYDVSSFTPRGTTIQQLLGESTWYCDCVPSEDCPKVQNEYCYDISSFTYTCPNSSIIINGEVVDLCGDNVGNGVIPASGDLCTVGGVRSVQLSSTNRCRNTYPIPTSDPALAAIDLLNNGSVGLTTPTLNQYTNVHIAVRNSFPISGTANSIDFSATWNVGSGIAVGAYLCSTNEDLVLTSGTLNTYDTGACGVQTTRGLNDAWGSVNNGINHQVTFAKADNSTFDLEDVVFYTIVMGSPVEWLSDIEVNNTPPSVLSCQVESQSTLISILENITGTLWTVNDDVICTITEDVLGELTCGVVSIPPVITDKTITEEIPLTSLSSCTLNKIEDLLPTLQTCSYKCSSLVGTGRGGITTATSFTYGGIVASSWTEFLSNMEEAGFTVTLETVYTNDGLPLADSKLLCIEGNILIQAPLEFSSALGSQSIDLECEEIKGFKVLEKEVVSTQIVCYCVQSKGSVKTVKSQVKSLSKEFASREVKVKESETKPGKILEVCEERRYDCNGDYLYSTYLYQGKQFTQEQYDKFGVSVVDCNSPAVTYSPAAVTCATEDNNGTNVVVNCQVFTNDSDPTDTFTQYTLAADYTPEGIGTIGDIYTPLSTLNVIPCPPGSIVEDEQCYEALVNIKGVANTGDTITVATVTNNVAGTTLYTITHSSSGSIIYTGTDPVGDVGIDISDATTWVLADCDETVEVSTCCPIQREACIEVGGIVFEVYQYVDPTTGNIIRVEDIIGNLVSDNIKEIKALNYVKCTCDAEVIYNPPEVSDGFPDAAGVNDYFTNLGICPDSRLTCNTNVLSGSTTQATFNDGNNVTTGFHGVRTCNLGLGETITVTLTGANTGTFTGTGAQVFQLLNIGSTTVTVTLNSTGACNGTIIQTYNITVI